MKKLQKLSLAAWIFIGLALGILVGMGLMGHPEVARIYFKPLGTIFLHLLQFIVVPIVLFSIIMGVISLKDIRKVGSIGGKTVGFYLCTTACAVSIGLLFASLWQSHFAVLETSDLVYEGVASISLMDTLVNIFPANILAPLVNANMLQVIVIALFFGFGIILVGPKGAPAAALVESLQEISMKVMTMIIKLSPLGVFCLIIPVVAENGPGILGSLAMVLGVAYLAYLGHVLVVYSVAVKALGKVVRDFFQRYVACYDLGFFQRFFCGSIAFEYGRGAKTGG